MELSPVIRLGLVGFFLNCTLLSLFVPAQDGTTRITATWLVKRYDINATLPRTDTERNLAAKARLELRNVSTRPASTLTLRISPVAEVSTINVNGTNVDFTKGEEKIDSVRSLQRLVIRIPTVAPEAILTAIVDYKLTVKDNSGLASISPIGTQFLPLSFWYPTPNSWYFARGADFAPFNLTIVSESSAAVSSGETGAGSANGYVQKFSGQPFLVAGNWDKTEVNGISCFLPKGSDAEAQKRAAELAALAAEAKTFAANLLGPAPVMPIRIVAVKRGSGFSGGGTILVDEGVFRRSRIDSQTAMSIAEAVVKLWLGNAASVNGDGNGVVREGLTRFIATQFLESKFGKDVADIERLRQRVAYASVVARDSPLNVVSPLDDYYYPVVANKGAMVWRLLAQKAGSTDFYARTKTSIQDNSTSLAEIRAAFPEQKEFLDDAFDQVTDTNLQAGLPQTTGGESKIALRNTGSVDVTVDIEALLANGQRMSAPSTIRAKSFGEIIFKTASRINRVEIDREKLFPQTDYSDDVAPRELTESDPLLVVKRLFDKQEFVHAEKAARSILDDLPRLDDVRVLLGRSLLSLGRTTDAEKEFRAVLDEKLPTSRSIAWANFGLADVAAKGNQSEPAIKFANQAIRADAEYGASLAARALRNRLNAATNTDPSVTAFFANFDKAAAANQKAEIESMVVQGDVSKFASGIAGQTVQWKTQIVQIDKIDANSVFVEVMLTVKLLNREIETGTAVYRLTKSGGNWKMSAVDVFEVR